MPQIDEKVLQAVVEAAIQDPDTALEILRIAALTEAKNTNTVVDPEEEIQTIPEDPDLSNIKYLTLLRKSVRGKKPDPMVVLALHTIFKKWGYNLLAKVVVKVARKMRYHLRTKDVESILTKYGKVIVPFLAVLLVDIIRQYHKASQETIELDIPTSSTV